MFNNGSVVEHVIKLVFNINKAAKVPVMYIWLWMSLSFSLTHIVFAFYKKCYSLVSRASIVVGMSATCCKIC